MPVLTRDQNQVGNYEHAEVHDLYTTNATEQVDMGVADGALSLILEMLSDVSSNRGAYVLREAYSNAYDATKATGDMSRRIDITIPDKTYEEDTIAYRVIADRPDGYKCEPVTVTDNGIGMSEDDVRRYFLQYGGSKKRDDVDAVGSKGLGSKAPLAVTDTFEVRTRKDGIETYAVISRANDRNTASITSYPTSKGNGTTVSIPIGDAHTLSQVRECADTLMATNIDANLYVNGEKSTRLTECDGIRYLGNVPVGQDANGNDVSFDVYFARHDNSPYGILPLEPDSANIKVVIGGFPYNLRTSRYLYSTSGEYFVVGDPGYLNFTPSRDEIKDDAAHERFTKAIISGIKNFDKSEYVSRSAAEMTPLEKMTLAESAQKITAIESGYRLTFNWFNANVDASLYQHNGHNLMLACHNDENGRASFEDTHMLVVTRQRISRSKNEWWVNGYHAQDGKFVNARPMAEDSTCIVPVNCFMFEASRNIESLRHGKVTNAIVTGFDFDDRRKMMSKFNWIARELSKYADVAGSVIRLFCVDDEHQLDSVRDIIDELNDDGAKVVKWDDLLQSANKLASSFRSEYVSSSNDGQSMCYVIDLDGKDDTVSVARTAASISDGTQSVMVANSTTLKLYRDIDRDTIGSSVCACLQADDARDAGAMALMLMTLARHDMLGFKPSHAIVMCHPYASDVRDCEAHGGRFAYDTRRGSVKHASTIASDGNIKGVRTFDKVQDAYAYRVKPAFEAWYELPADLVFDDYAAPRWARVRQSGQASMLDKQDCSVRTAADYALRSGIIDGTRLAQSIEAILHPSNNTKMSTDDYNAYRRLVGDQRLCRTLRITGINSTKSMETEEGKRTIEALQLIDKSGLATMMARSFAYDERTKSDVREIVGRRLSETFPGAMDKA